MPTIRAQTLSHTTSRDGTQIGFFASGEGPPLLLVHGGLGDHTRWGPLLPYLEPHFAVYAMDRRGRGASGDSADYEIEREYDDVAAVVDAIAEMTGSPVGVYCSSFGGICAFGAATLTRHIGGLALYEGWPLPRPETLSPSTDFVARVEALLAAGDREAALKAFYLEVVGLSEEQFAPVRAQPSWPNRVAAAGTMLREERAFRAATFDPAQAARITVPTLLLVGSDSPDWEAETVAAALPDARVAVLEGQAHVADLLAPGLVADHLLAFFGNGRGGMRGLAPVRPRTPASRPRTP
jgi:pimeloyl-ACP methyl ester carboxylesterase